MQGHGATSSVPPNLGQYLTQLIAAADAVRPEEVTPEYIHEQRETRIYPHVRYNLGSDYGGYCSDGLEFLTVEEFNRLRQEIDSYLNGYGVDPQRS